MVPYVAKPYESATVDLLDRVNRIFKELVRISPDERTSDNKTTLLALFTSLAMEHFRAIVILVESQVATGSAFTLLRPLLESIARASGYISAEQTKTVMHSSKVLSTSRVYSSSLKMSTGKLVSADG